MSPILDNLRAAGATPAVYYSASEAGRHLGRPVSQILRAVRTLNLPASRAGNARSAALLLQPADLDRIEEFFTK